MTTWAWKDTSHGGSVKGGVTWVAGTLEDSYRRVAGHGGTWILVSAVPPSEYRRVLTEAAT